MISTQSQLALIHSEKKKGLVTSCWEFDNQFSDTYSVQPPVATLPAMWKELGGP